MKDGLGICRTALQRAVVCMRLAVPVVRHCSPGICTACVDHVETNGSPLNVNRLRCALTTFASHTRVEFAAALLRARKVARWTMFSVDRVPIRLNVKCGNQKHEAALNLLVRSAVFSLFSHYRRPNFEYAVGRVASLVLDSPGSSCRPSLWGPHVRR